MFGLRQWFWPYGVYTNIIMFNLEFITLAELVHRQSHRIHGFPSEQGGLITPTWRVPVGAQFLYQHIVLESIPSPSGTDLIPIGRRFYCSYQPTFDQSIST